MKAMLEPRMVAANTHGRDSLLQGERSPLDRITASSQGCFMQDVDADSPTRDAAIEQASRNATRRQPDLEMRSGASFTIES
jgi:hypothetical protein